MTRPFPTRRRAAQLDEAVETGRTDGLPAEVRELAAVATALREAPPVQPRPEFSADLRARLMAAAATELAPAAATEPAAEPADRTRERLTVGTGVRRGGRRLKVAIGAVAIVGATSSMAVAAQGSLPGDTLYPVKRAVENVRTGITVSDADRAQRLLDQAGRRLTEVEQTTREARPAAAVEEGLRAYAEQSDDAGERLLETHRGSDARRAAGTLREFAADGVQRLAAIEPLVPEAARPELGAAASTLLEIDAAAQAACPDCPEPGVTSLPPGLVSLMAGEAPATPAPTASAPARPDPRPRRPGIELPTVDPGDLPGSVRQPDAGVPSPTPAPSSSPAPSPDGQGDRDPTPAPQPSGTRHHGGLLDLGPADGPTSPSPSPSHDPVRELGDGVGGLVDGVVDGVGGLLGSVGGLLGLSPRR